MEKVIYVLWKDAAADGAAWMQRLRSELAPRLRALPCVHGVKLNLCDADVAPAAALRQQHTQPQPDALVQLWLDSAIAHLRAEVDRAVGAHAQKSAAWLVTESQPLRNSKHAPRPGERTYGFAQVALLKKPEKLPYADWLDVWHNSHTQVAVETQSTFEYIQNVVVRALTPGAPAWDAMVEECFPPEAMADPYTFFDARGDEAKFKRNLQRMMDSVQRFIELGRLDVLPTSQYRYD
ncbi:MAG TPA: hypothetical protein VHE37_11120 [Nevskiaceae bacterium]|nr:hypothetical protein [Nevskiaceae bacterium]